MRLARDLVNEFPDGVWLVDLAPLSVPDLVAQTIATTLGVREGAQRSARDALLDTLRHRELLLVLDTCEHLIAACAELVEALLRGAPQLRILATSREALGVPGETVCRVPSLSFPEALASIPVDTLVESEATQLFIALCQELEDPRGIAWSLDVFAGLLAARGYADGAARLWGASDGLLESVGGSLVPTIGWIRDRYFEPVKTSLGGDAFETAR